MSVAHLDEAPPTVTVEADRFEVHHLVVHHPEATAFVRARLQEAGQAGAEDLLRRALPVGLVALNLGTAAVDTGALARTLDSFAATVDKKSESALANLDQTVARLREGEQSMAQAASAIVESLPARLEAALAGQAGNVRANVAEATRAVQAAAMQELTATLTRHSDSLRDTLSLDREGPVRMLRQELMAGMESTRRELSEQLVFLRSLVEADQVTRKAGAKATRAVGAANEEQTLQLCEQVVTAAGDLFEATGAQPGAGTSSRTGDAVATLSPAITGSGPALRLCLEAKHRTRALTVKAMRQEIDAGCRNREAAGGLLLVSTPDQLPGEAAFIRLGPTTYAVAASDPTTVSLIYLLLREVIVATHLSRSADSEIDLSQVEARLKRALAAADDLDEMGRLAVQAQRSLTKLIEVGRQTQQNLRASLTEGVTLLHT